MIIKDVLVTLKIDPEAREIHMTNNNFNISISLPSKILTDNQEDVSDNTNRIPPSFSGISIDATSAKIAFFNIDDDDYSEEMIKLLKIIKLQLKNKKVINAESFLSLLEKHIDKFFKEY